MNVEPAGTGPDRALRQGLSALDLEAPGGLLDGCMHYVALVQKWSAAMNLVGDARHAAMVGHLLDALAVLRLPLPPHPVVDVGSGAGLPGVPLALALAPRALTLVEPRERRATFLHTVRRVLALNHVTVAHARLQNLPRPTGPATFVSRALAPPVEALALAGAHGFTDAVVMTTRDARPSSVPSGWRLVAVDEPPLEHAPDHINLLLHSTLGAKGTKPP